MPTQGTSSLVWQSEVFLCSQKLQHSALVRSLPSRYACVLPLFASTPPLASVSASHALKHHAYSVPLSALQYSNTFRTSSHTQYVSIYLLRSCSILRWFISSSSRCFASKADSAPKPTMASNLLVSYLTSNLSRFFSISRSLLRIMSSIPICIDRLSSI